MQFLTLKPWLSWKLFKPGPLYLVHRLGMMHWRRKIFNIGRTNLSTDRIIGGPQAIFKIIGGGGGGGLVPAAPPPAAPTPMSDLYIMGKSVQL